MGKNLKKYVKFSMICTIIKHIIVVLLFFILGLFTITNNDLVTEYTIIYFSIVLIIFFRLIYLLIKQIYFIKNIKLQDLKNIEHELENPILIVKTDYILTDTYKCDKLPDNVILYNNIHNIEYLQILNKCYAVVIPLKDPNISSGQLVMLRAMQYKKPIIITNSKAVDSYVKDGYNALVIDKNDEAFVNATNVLLQDKDFYDQLVDNGYTEYKKKYSLSALGKNIGNLFAENSVVSIR